MTSTPDDATVETVKYYLSRADHILVRLSDETDPDTLLAVRIAPDMFDTGFNFAIAIQFAARALCPPAGLDVPEIPDRYTCETLRKFADEIADLIAPIRATDLVRDVSHAAGDAELCQTAADYVTRFALPNMIFHLSLAYAGLRHGGMDIGKADFDGLHRY
ncbi:DUF1993 family protein [Litoreibacter roseus]|nr:DUF1993 family protein [Litoreibacter roseus]